LETIDKFLNDASNSSNVVELIWHGGEPMLAGINRFNEIINIQDNIRAKKNVEFKNCIQTNGTLINEEWLSVFYRGEFSVSISLDGPNFINDKYRLFQSGNSSYLDTMRGIRLLQRNDMNFSVLSVLTMGSIEYPEEIYDFFIENDIKRFDFLPYIEVSHPINDEINGINLLEGSLNQGDFSNFIIRIFNRWFYENDPSISIRFIDEAIKGLMGGKPALCKFNGSCKDYLTIDYDGEVSNCDCLRGNNEFAFGNVNDKSINQIAQSDKRMGFIKKESVIRSECLNCKYFRMCNGGCRRYSYMFNNDFRDQNYLCRDRINIFSHISNIIKKEHPKLDLV